MDLLFKMRFSFFLVTVALATVQSINSKSGGIRSQMMGGSTIPDDRILEAQPRTDGYRHYDTPKLIEKLKELNANHYTFVIWNNPTDYDDLIEFLPRANDAGIQVMVYIVPPSECSSGGRCSRPFKTDYIAWAKAFGQLSLNNTNLVAWAIDDFSVNTKFFTRNYLTSIVKTFKNINPNLKLYTTAYYDKITNSDYLDTYKDYVDGFIYPYLDGPNLNTQRSSSLSLVLDQIVQLFKTKHLQLIVLIYAGRYSAATLPPDDLYVEECLETAQHYQETNKTIGTLLYGLPMKTELPALSSDNRAMFGSGRLSLSAAKKPTRTGDLAEAWQMVEVEANRSRYEISFWVWDQYDNTPQLIGYHHKRVVLDGHIIYESDVMDSPQMQWRQGDALIGPVDVTGIVRGKEQVKLQLQLVEVKGVARFQVDVGFDHIETIGLRVKNSEFETHDHWTINSTSGSLIPSIRIWRRDMPERIFEVAKKAFGQLKKKHE